MTPYYDILYVVMRKDLDEVEMHHTVSAVFESREKADAYVAKCHTHPGLDPAIRYYVDASFHNVFEA